MTPELNKLMKSLVTVTKLTTVVMAVGAVGTVLTNLQHFPKKHDEDFVKTNVNPEE
jgi:hypothetical protein